MVDLEGRALEVRSNIYIYIYVKNQPALTNLKNTCLFIEIYRHKNLFKTQGLRNSFADGLLAI